MNNLIQKMALGKVLDDQDLAQVLYDICDDEHASCNDDCPVYELNGHSPVGAHKPFHENRGCDCFKNGHAMLQFVRNAYRGQ